MPKYLESRHADGCFSVVKKAVSLPVLIGSGLTADNVGVYFGQRCSCRADGGVVGSDVKEGGDWKREIDSNRLERFMAAFNKLRTQ